MYQFLIFITWQDEEFERRLINFLYYILYYTARITHPCVKTLVFITKILILDEKVFLKEVEV